MKRFALMSALTTLVIALAHPRPIHAGILFDSGVPSAQVVNADASDAKAFGLAGGGGFTLGAASHVTEVQWSGIYNNFASSPSDDFTIQFFNFTGTTPDTIPAFSYSVGNAVNRTDTGIKLFGLAPLFSYDAAIPDTSLAPGHYLVSIYDSTSEGFAWSFGPAVTDSVPFIHDTAPGSAWSQQTIGSYAFSLIGTSAVPEPSSIAMLSCGAVGVLGYARRRARSVAR